MSSKFLALLIGGFLPAILLGIATLFQKLAMLAGIGTGPFLICVGLSITGSGLVVLAVDRDLNISWTAALYSCLFGVCWAVATFGIAVALKHFGGQLSQLVPLYNMNTLVAVLLALGVLAEWKQVSAANVSAGAVLIVIGGILAARA